MAGNSDLIGAIAVAIARALQAHGITAEAGNGTVHELCAELCRDFGGEDYWIPKTYRTGRDAVVVKAVRNGATVREAARVAGISPDTTRRIIRRRQSPGLGRDDWVL